MPTLTGPGCRDRVSRSNDSMKDRLSAGVFELFGASLGLCKAGRRDDGGPARK